MKKIDGNKRKRQTTVLTTRKSDNFGRYIIRFLLYLVDSSDIPDLKSMLNA